MAKRTRRDVACPFLCVGTCLRIARKPVLTPAETATGDGQRPDRLPPLATASRRRGRRRRPPSFPRRKEQEGRVLRPARGGSGMERAAAAALGCALRSPSPSPSPAPQWPPLLRCHRRCPPGPPRPLLPPALRFR